MKVCILGNSLTALTLAKALVNQNIYVDILHNKKNLNISHTRTIGISKNNIDYFNKHIISIEKLLWKIKKIEIFAENLKKERLLNFEKNNEHLFSIIRNYKLIKLLEKDLSKNKFFKVKFLDNSNLSFLSKYDLVINCDPSGIITKRYFSKKIIKKYNCYAHTTIIKHDKILNDVAFQIFTKKGPLAFLPISNKETSIVFSVHNSIDQKKENIKQLIKNKNFRYKIEYIKNINSFELKFLNLRSYYHKNILAFGDLLHKVHPLAGQGFNMTIRDIKILLDIIKDRLDLGLPLDSSVNIEFQKNLRHKNFIFSTGIDLIHEFFNIERKMKDSSLSKSVKLIGMYPVINKLFTKIADRGVLF
jgi:2-octaprenyl-6-methoxyphenol hydroxylase